MNNLQNNVLADERDTLQYMYDVQKTLFDAYKEKHLFTIALKIVAQRLTAEKVCFLGLKEGKIREIFVCGDFGAVEDFNKTRIYNLLTKANGYILRGNSLLLYPEQIRHLPQTEQEELKRREINNLMLSPVTNSEGELSGVLAGFNMSKKWENCAMLECVCGDFLMACSNIRFAQEIEVINHTDSVTGLQNRRCFEEDVNTMERNGVENLCCIYIDVNGLHTLNNTLGHAAGDEMLRSMGENLQKFFSWGICYRIGGDEFVVIESDTNIEDIKKKAAEVEGELKCRGYSASSGVAGMKETGSLREMLTLAEKRMYKAKEEYYKNGEHATHIRGWNEKLEQMLIDKRDADSFMDILASRFLGVYVIDMKKDAARIIYALPIFKEILNRNNQCFSASMKDYVEKYVAEKDEAGVLELLDFTNVHERLNDKRKFTFPFERKDGGKVNLHVYRALSYGTTNEDTVWMFENEQDHVF